MRRGRWWQLMLVTVAFAAACAGPEKSESEAEPNVYMEAEQEIEPEPPPPVVPVPVAQPSPGQLRPQPDAETPAEERREKARAEATEKDPDEVIDAANEEARERPVPEGYFNAIQEYDYTRGMLYQVYCARNKVTAVRFGPGETVKSVAMGDTTRWIIGRTESGSDAGAREIVLVKPVRPYLETNMTVTTDRRVYQLELHSYKNSYMASVSWRYPRDLVEQFVGREEPGPGAPSRRGETMAGIDVGSNLSDLNFGYAFVYADRDNLPRWMPRRVFDNGEKTFIQFPEGLKKGGAPALFVLSEEGNPQIVNYRLKGDFYIVDGLFDVAELRMGEDDEGAVGIERQANNGRGRR